MTCQSGKPVNQEISDKSRSVVSEWRILHRASVPDSKSYSDASEEKENPVCTCPCKPIIAAAHRPRNFKSVCLDSGKNQNKCVYIKMPCLVNFHYVKPPLVRQLGRQKRKEHIHVNFCTT